MEITAKELRGKPGLIIDQASRGTEVIITIRGKKMARLVPYKMKNLKNEQKEVEDEIFGLWADKKNDSSVEEYVRSIRKRRSF
jgi:prevent-host-death family protein